MTLNIEMSSTGYYSTLYAPSTYPKVQILASFVLWPTIFEIKGCQDLEMHQITSEWPWTLSIQKYQYPTHIKYSSAASHFQDTRLLKSKKSEMYQMTSDWP